MNTYGQSPAHRPQPSGVNPFARALAEARGGDGSDTNAPQNTAPHQELTNPLEQQRQMLEQQRRERLRQELHRRINPVDQKDVFDAKQQQVKKEVESIRHEIDLLVQEVKDFREDLQIAAMGNVVEVGESGKGAKGYFAGLKQFIILVREQVHSARTWATTLGNKKSQQAGLNYKAKGHAQTKNIYDTMHHERQIAHAGG